MGEPVECSNNFVFVGAEIKTGKSSIRSKQTKKKVILDPECILVVIGGVQCVVASNSRWRRSSCNVLYCQHKAVVDLTTNPVNLHLSSPIHYMQTILGRRGREI